MKEKARRKRKNERKGQKQGTKRKQKQRQEGRKKEKKKKERQIKRNRKRGRPKRAKGERKRNTENKQKMPFSGGKQGFFSVLNNQKTKPKKNQTTKTTKINKEGLGPSEVALWATSPDP